MNEQDDGSSINAHQAMLLEALEKHQFVNFIRSVKAGADVNFRSRGAQYSVFELACKTPGKKDFIRACINHGAFVHQVNHATGEFPIHLAAKSKDSENLYELLNGKDVIVDQQCPEGTALCLLFGQLSYNNRKRVFECIKLLLQHHANINVRNEMGDSPIGQLVKGRDNWRKYILKHCLNNYKVNVNEETKAVINRYFPKVTIPEYDSLSHITDMLKDKLNGDEADFITEYDACCEPQQLPDESIKDLLEIAVSRRKLQIVQKLIGSQITQRNVGSSLAILSGVLAKCCMFGNFYILQWLLQAIPTGEVLLFNEDPLLVLLVKKIDVQVPMADCQFFKCFQILINDERVGIDKCDEAGCTALYYAAKYRIYHVQELLLAKGAFIGGEDTLGVLTITEIDPGVLEKHLDSCISDNGRNPGDKNHEVKVEISNFVPPMHKSACASNNGQLFRGISCGNEILSIMALAKSVEHKQLLRHPLISCILHIKWLKYRWFLIFDLVMCAVFFGSVTFCAMFDGVWGNSEINFSFYPSAVTGWFYLLVRELSQFRLNARIYLTFMTNWLEMVLVLVSGSFLFYEFEEKMRPTAAASVILLSALEVMFIVGTFPLFSTYMVMVKMVSKNFLKCLILYSIIMLAFAFSFYTLSRAENSSSELYDNSQRFNWFADPSLALIKTVVMLTGEYEAANMPLGRSWELSFLFTLFLFFVPLVLFNLMNGIAVSDTTNIKDESELIAIRQIGYAIYLCETALETDELLRCFTRVWRNKVFRRIVGQHMLWQVNAIKCIAIKHNQANTILLPSRETQNNRESDFLEGVTALNPCFPTEVQPFRLTCSSYKMDNKIVHSLLGVLYSKQTSEGSSNIKLERCFDQLNESISIIAKDIHSMKSTVDSLMIARI